MTIDVIHCRRNKFCLNSENRQACGVCKYNTASMAIPKVDYFKTKIPGIRFLGEDTF